MRNCGELLLQMLGAYGVDTVFGIPGVHTVEMYRGLPASGIRHVTPRHEQGAGFMADGYARVSGKPGVCLIITGPGMTNIATAMAQALADSIPMLVVSSVNRRHELGMGEGRLHELRRQQLVFDELARFSHTLQRPDELPRVLARAFGVFTAARPGPVHIEIPLDVIDMDATHVDPTPWPLPSPPGPSAEALRQAANLLGQAKTPLIAVGGGAVNAEVPLRHLAERLQAPVINTVNAKGLLPPSHPLAVGGSASCPPLRQALLESDVVLALGTELGETDYDFYFAGDPEISGTLIRVDIDAAQLARAVQPGLAICSDARLAIDALCALLPDTPPGGAGAARAQALREALTAIREEAYAAFFATLQTALPELILVGDSTQPTYRAWLQYESSRPRSYFHSASGYGTLGYAIPAAIGARLAAPERPVVALIGDGAAQFTLTEMAAAVEMQLPVIFLLWNNAGYEEIRRFMRDAEVEEIGVNIHTPDFLAVATGLGCRACRVSSHEDLAAALSVAATAAGPTLIEVLEADFV